MSQAHDHVYVIGLGGNQGAVLRTLRAAVDRLDASPGVRVLLRSPVYRSAAMGPPQPDFLNAACKLSVQDPPAEVLGLLQHIEHDLGRVREMRWGPRTLDLDMLWADVALQTPQLTVPHVGLRERWWALRPLLDVAPELSPEYGPDLARLGPIPSPVDRL